MCTANATEINYLDGITLGTASASKVLSVDSNLDVQSIRNLSIDGDLIVGGTTTTVNSTVVTIDDPIFTLDTAPAVMIIKTVVLSLGGIMVQIKLDFLVLMIVQVNLLLFLMQQIPVKFLEEPRVLDALRL